MEKQQKISAKLLPQIAILLIRKGALLDMRETGITINNYLEIGLPYDMISRHAAFGHLVAWNSNKDQVHAEIFEKGHLKRL